MRESRTYGSVRGASGDGRPYRDHIPRGAAVAAKAPHRVKDRAAAYRYTLLASLPYSVHIDKVPENLMIFHLCDMVSPFLEVTCAITGYFLVRSANAVLWGQSVGPNIVRNEGEPMLGVGLPKPIRACQGISSSCASLSRSASAMWAISWLLCSRSSARTRSSITNAAKAKATQTPAVPARSA
jgi:hypothetical protein